MAAPKEMQLSSVTATIRWCFNCFVLSFLAIILSGVLLTQIPQLRISTTRGKQSFHFFTGVLNFTAYGDEVIIGFSGFLFILFTTGLLLSGRIPTLLSDSFGISVGRFESHCIFSSFCLICVSVVLFLLYSIPQADRGDNPAGYETLIKKLSESDGDDDNAE